MQLTVKDLKKRISELDDYAEVLIERVTDVHLEEHGWKTSEIKFGPETADVFPVFYATKCQGKLVILVHSYIRLLGKVLGTSTNGNKLKETK